MSKKKTTPVKGSKNPFKGFININLTTADKKRIKSALMTVEEVPAFVGDAVEQGYAIKFAYDDYGDCISVMMSGERTATVNKGYIISARHTDIMVALTIINYIHNVMAEQGEWADLAANVNNNDW